MGSTPAGISRRAARVAATGLAIALFGVATPAAAQTEAAASTITVTGFNRPSVPNLFGTVAVPARVSRYADGWFRSRQDASSHPAMQRLIAPARGLPKEAQLAYVQRAVTQQIHWVSDATEWGKHDYWATAAQTLDHGAGDMEDRAIVKLQALKSLGFPGRDLYLTMGRDKVGGQLTVLVVRMADRFYVLDDLGGRPVAAEYRQGFEPFLTFGANTTWLHGRRVHLAAAGGRSAAR
jgi:predicted transglutaminase-like cysteine proteinase